MSRLTVPIDWRNIAEGDEEWVLTRCLYAYTIPQRPGPVYIGKAWGTTVRDRWNRAAKEALWDDLEAELGAYHHATFVGVLGLPRGHRLTGELLADVESLLIASEQPWGNIQSMKSRISRPGLDVQCIGDWPGRQRTYRDW